MQQVIQVAEWGKVELPPHFDNQRTKARLQRGGTTSFGNALILRGRHLYAQRLVGVIDAGPLQLQIVPKVYANSTAEQDAGLLLELFVMNAPSRVAVVQAETMAHRASVLEPLIRYFATILERHLRTEGIPRRYEERSEQSSTLRGRVDLSKLAKTGPVYSYRLPIVHYPLQVDNPLSRVLRALALELARRSGVAHTKATLYRCAALLGQAKRETLRPALIKAVHLTRYEKPWKAFLELAALLAAGTAPNPVRPGEGSTTGILLPLELLFENALREALRKAAQTTPLHVSQGPGSLRLIRALNGSQEMLTLKPDLIFRDEIGTPKVLGDVKWKRIQFNRRSFGLTPGDAYQILAYIHRFSAKRGVLFYPASEPIAGTWRGSTWTVLGQHDRTVDIVEVDVARLLAAARVRADQDVLVDLSRLVVHLAEDAK
jgi:5-methylcytosine-specific restriction enzyme subunit McrC